MKKDEMLLDKEEFINFLSHATPEDLNKLIAEKGKPPKPVEPIFFFDKYKKSDNNS